MHKKRDKERKPNPMQSFIPRGSTGLGIGSTRLGFGSPKFGVGFLDSNMLVSPVKNSRIGGLNQLGVPIQVVSGHSGI